jgi:hypothetical protein
VDKLHIFTEKQESQGKLKKHRITQEVQYEAALFVGSTRPGYLRNVKSSFLWVTRRLRIVSASLLETGFLYSSLNLFRILFFSERQLSGERLEYIL